jgi:hypothetical protein
VAKNLRIAAREAYDRDHSYGQGERLLIAGEWYGSGQSITVQLKVNNTLVDIVDGAQRIDVIERPPCGGRGFAVQNDTGRQACQGTTCSTGSFTSGVFCMCFEGFTGARCEGSLFGATATANGVFSKLVAGGADGASYISEDSGATWVKQQGLGGAAANQLPSSPQRRLLEASLALRDTSSHFGRVLRSFVPLKPVVLPTYGTLLCLVACVPTTRSRSWRWP